jgi:hypothetical protein
MFDVRLVDPQRAAFIPQNLAKILGPAALAPLGGPCHFSKAADRLGP